MISYTGKTELEEKVNAVLKEMKQDNDFIYTIRVYENREDEKISKFMFEVVNIQNSMPNF